MTMKWMLRLSSQSTRDDKQFYSARRRHSSRPPCSGSKCDEKLEKWKIWLQKILLAIPRSGEGLRWNGHQQKEREWMASRLRA
jgi:hypothetical protein